MISSQNCCSEVKQQSFVRVVRRPVTFGSVVCFLNLLKSPFFHDTDSYHCDTFPRQNKSLQWEKYS